MEEFKIHTIESAPADSKESLQKAMNSYGMIPNLLGAMAESPETLKAYQKLSEYFNTSSLTPHERHIVWLTISTYHSCHYCVPIHTLMAYKDKLPEPIINALRSEDTLPDFRLEGLRTFTLAILDKRGDVDKKTVQNFIESGFNKQNVLDVILGVAHKTMSNYINHIIYTPVDQPFRKYLWEDNFQGS